MPAILANARDFLLNSDYPLDKVIYLKSGSAPMDGSSFFQFAHGLPFKPLLDMTWSYTADFSTTYFNGTGPVGVSGLYDLQLYVASDNTNVYISAAGGVAPLTTVYYRIFGLQPDDAPNAMIAPTISSTDDFNLNSSYNYTKLLSTGSVAISGSVNIVVPHNLGYIPQVQVWQDVSAGWMELVSDTGDAASGSWFVNPTSNNLNLIYTGAATGKVYWRIYLDE